MSHSSHITIKFVNFWPSLNPEDNKFTNILRIHHNVTVLDSQSDEVPDILFYSRCDGFEHYKYDCLKVYYSGENDFPNLNECDYAITHYPYSCGSRNLRYPLFMLFEQAPLAINPAPITDSEALGRQFCSVVMSNAANCHPKRLKIINAVDNYKPVAFGGAYRNNVGGRVDDKHQFISRYKFNLALENTIVDGYVTEKIMEPLAANTVPIYWGCDLAKRDFNPDAFINVEDYDSIESFISALKRIDHDPAEYLAMLRAANGLSATAAQLDESLLKFLDNIADTRKRHVTKYAEIGDINTRNSILYPLTLNRHIYRAAKFLSLLNKKK